MKRKEQDIIDQGVCSLLNLHEYSPCVIGARINGSELTVYVRPTTPRHCSYYKDVEKEIIKIITTNLGLKHINTLKTEYDNSELDVIFEMLDPKALVVLFKMRGISARDFTQYHFLKKLPAAPIGTEIYLTDEEV